MAGGFVGTVLRAETATVIAVEGVWAVWLVPAVGAAVEWWRRAVAVSALGGSVDFTRCDGLAEESAPPVAVAERVLNFLPAPLRFGSFRLPRRGDEPVFESWAPTPEDLRVERSASPAAIPAAASLSEGFVFSDLPRGLDGFDTPALDSPLALLALDPPAGLPVSADATQLPEASTAPIPSATARPPTRPTYADAFMRS
ncbi:hypothetical protein [Mycobacterium sp. DL440]|uniref:hypothetical protein n=1 Tax=Mycobacterium sp. DL440 TaxID=2675523 RepID=UPI00142050D6|nr:hypothetical protein [Mycobacterium sp. DL440]